MKTSEAKIAANRRNATRSTGPRTASGKSRAATNSLKHGVFSRATVIPAIGEENSAYDEFVAALHRHFQPANPVEALLVNDFADAQWRISRVRRAEAGHFDTLCSELYDKSLIADGSESFSPTYGEWTQPGRGENRLLGDAFAISCSAGSPLNNFSRHEARLRHAAYRALDHLLELRRAKPANGENEPKTPIIPTSM
ncbi:MAG: hypothetical protein U0Q16_24995 [Bryobacteraceae bacterium]